MKVRYIDAHCHIQFDQYAHDDIALIRRMEEEGVLGIVVGVDRESSEKAVALAEQHDHLYASVGLHPNRVAEESFDEEAYRKLADHPKVVAIGECGLDYFRPAEVNEEVKRAQKDAFKKHIELASGLGKPLIIHSRPSKGTQDAYTDLISLLTEAKEAHPNLRGDIHFFVGGPKEAEALIGLGFTVSFTAVITFARDYDPVIRAIPLDAILSETDAPYVAPAPRRGERNDPLAVRDVVSKIAEIRNEDPEAVRAALFENAQKLFSLPMWG
ncbi:MAG: TatD family hydrolase [Patescibacteria group bacterium]|nr:TatD family hydrolase [Patescibacteria group bacterium]